METYGRRIGDIPAEIVRAKVLESFGRRIAAVSIMVMSVSIVGPAIVWPSVDFSALSVDVERRARQSDESIFMGPA